jgi:hypothetical protein
MHETVAVCMLDSAPLGENAMHETVAVCTLDSAMHSLARPQCSRFQSDTSPVRPCVAHASCLPACGFHVISKPVGASTATCSTPAAHLASCALLLTT